VTYTADSGTPTEKQDPGYSFSSETATALIGFNNPNYTFNAPILNNPNGVDVSYSSENENVATVDPNGVVELIGAGVTTIKATSKETDTYKEGEAHYTLTVKEITGDGTKATSPYSVSDYYTLNEMDLLDGSFVYVKGIITSVDMCYGGQMSYYISDDDKTSNQLTIYGKGLDNTPFSAQTDLMAGSKVVLTGRPSGLELYNSYLTSIDVPFDVFDDGYATLYYGGFALKIPAGVTATVYSYADNNLNASKTYTEGDVLPAKTAVVLNAVGGKYYFPGTTETGETPEATNLYGYDKATTTDVDGMGKYYMLSLNADKDPNSIGFYWGNEDGAAFTSKPHKAFLALPADATAKGFAFNDVTNGISAKTITAEQDNAPVYSLMGMRMSGKLPAGIYVKNGKKFVVK